MGELRELSKLCPSCGGDRLILKKVVLVFSVDEIELREPSLADGAYNALATGKNLDADQTKVSCKKCRAEFPLRFLEDFYVALLDGLRVALNDLSEHRNRECHQLCSFGGRDADLEAEGCTGIDAFVGEDQDFLCIQVSGHKTVCDSSCLELGESWVCEDCKCEGCHRPEVCPECGSKKIGHTGYSERMRESFDEQAASLICDTGFSVERGSDEWVVFFKYVIKQRMVNPFEGQTVAGGIAYNIDFIATAEQIVKKAHNALYDFEKTMAQLSKQLDELYEHVNSECTEP